MVFPSGCSRILTEIQENQLWNLDVWKMKAEFEVFQMTVFRHTPVWSCRSLWHRSNRQMSDRCLRDPEDENTFIYTRLFAILCFKWEIRKMIMSSTLEKIKGLYRKEKKTWRQDLNHQPSNWEAGAAPVSPARPGAPSPGEAQNWFMLFLVLDSLKHSVSLPWIMRTSCSVSSSSRTSRSSGQKHKHVRLVTPPVSLQTNGLLRWWHHVVLCDTLMLLYITRVHLHD